MRIKVGHFSRAFTLVEVLIASAVLALLLAMLSSSTGLTFSTIKRAQSKIDQFASARAGFERLTATLSQATLNTYWDYDNPSDPKAFERKSDLYFLTANQNTLSGTPVGQAIFFQAPLASGTSSPLPSGLFNAVGYWVDFGEAKWRPPHVPNRYRYRLIQCIQPTEALSVFKTSAASDSNVPSLLATPSSSDPLGFPISENIIALVLWPRKSLTQDPTGSQLSSNFDYSSRNADTTPQAEMQKAQLPPMIQVTMIVIDEVSAARLESGQAEPALITDMLKNRFRLVANYEDDLAAVKQALNAARINYLVLTSPVILRESKWSE